MKTIRTLSNISYNSVKFFETKINDLYNRGIVEWCYYIYHTKEDDELKDHIHFVFKPANRIDTSEVRAFLYERNSEDLTKPLTCTSKFMPCNSIDDWLLYAVHDINYLRLKGQWRKYHYEYADIKSTDYDCLLNDWQNINRKKYNLLDFLEVAVQQDIPFFKLVQDGLVPISQRSQYEFQYNALKSSYTAEQNKKTMRHLEHEKILFDYQQPTFDL